VTSVSRLEARLDDYQVGERVRLGVLRGGKHIDVEATLGSD
jgi:S1-C subfamily serine protease